MCCIALSRCKADVVDVDDDLMLPEEVADMFRVTRNTVIRWTRTGHLPPHSWVRLPGGHYRFKRSEIQTLGGNET